MDRLEPTRAFAVKIWWAFVWRAAAGTLLGGFVVGALLGVLAHFAGFSPAAVANIATLLGVALGLLVSIEVMYRVLKKRFRDFEIALIPRQP